jgi:hypothetical protein
MWATLADEVFELMRPMYSSMSLGLFPAAWMRVGWVMSVGMVIFAVQESGACIPALAAFSTERHLLNHAKPPHASARGCEAWVPVAEGPKSDYGQG